ncbi:MAG: YceH family protein [Sinobacteraceae bacterium]|nr:YceH family protein [Nevskiaceae bacterium]
MDSIQFTPVQARVLAVLVEKSVTTPQYYPMTVNAVRQAANQKSARDPVMALDEGEVGAALRSLEEPPFVARDDRGSRSIKWRHRFGHQLLIKPPALAVLAALMLRGPQTAAELRAHAAGMGGPDTVEEVGAILLELADRAQPLIAQLPRQSGQSAVRYGQLLCGELADAVAPTQASMATAAAAAPQPGLRERVEALEARVAELEQLLTAPTQPSED